MYKALTKNFFRNSDGVVIVYDVTNKSTFDQVQEWIKSIEDYAKSDSIVKKILVGNKIDLPRQVTTKEGQELADKYNLPFFEASAKDNIGIDECMNKIINDVVKEVFDSEKKGVGLNNGENDKKEGCC